MSSRRPLLVMSIPVLALAAIGLLVAYDATGELGYLWGALGVLTIITLVGVVVAGKSRLLDAFEPAEVAPSTDDIERVMAHNVAPAITAKSVIESSSGHDALGGERQKPDSAAAAILAPEPWPDLGLQPPPLPSTQLDSPEDVVEHPESGEEEVVTVLSPSTELFVNLGRRNKQLNRQMLTLIGHLRRDGIAPDTSEGLSELDHLATRMKRNEDILLMLASTRRVRQWSPGVPLDDVLRSAIGEVERSARVSLDDAPEVEVVGSVVADLAHLLAELVDNATEFSHSSTVVSISAQSTLEGLEIEVFDSGHGIDEEKLDGLNSLLADPPSVEEAPARRLGLFIAGHIASGLDVKVELAGQRGVGTVATVLVPNELLVEQPDGHTGSESELDALDLVDPVMQVLVSSELAEVDEDELAIASLPTETEVADALATFPSVEIVDPEPSTPPVTSGFPSIADIPEPGVFSPGTTHVDPPAVPLSSNLPHATFDEDWETELLEPMPPPTVLPISTLHDAEEEDAEGVARGVASSIAAFSAGVARGLADAEEELSTPEPEED